LAFLNLALINGGPKCSFFEKIAIFSDKKEQKMIEQGKILLLGGRGFIGGHICRSLLARNYNIRIFSASDSPLANLSDLPKDQLAALEIWRGNIDDFYSICQAMEGCQYLIHVAIPYPIYSLGWQKRWSREREALRNVLKVALDAGIVKCVFVNVSGTIGFVKHGLADESNAYHTPSKWTSLEMKHLAEQEILGFVNKGLPATIVNPCLCFGDYDTKPSSGLFLIYFVSWPFRMIRFMDDTRINVIDVKDVAEGAVSALEKGKIGERYLLGNENTTVRAFASRVRRIAGCKEPRITIPTFLIVVFSFATELVGLIAKRSQPYLPLLGIDILRYGSQHYSFNKARKELDLPQSSVDEAIRRALSWFKENKYLK
jgi:dihydroflavonol-4-reductase